MSSRQLPFLLLFPLLGVACGGSSAAFSAPRSVSAEQRPTAWDAPDQQRLRVQEVGAAKQKASKRYTADVPAGWEIQPPQPQRFRDLIWRVAGDASTECYLTAFVGGGVEQNVARWYGQFGAPAAPFASLPKIDLAGEQAHLLELAGTYQGKDGQAMMLAFVPRADGVTTVKFTGPEAVVKQHREAFLALVKSMRVEGEPTTQEPKKGEAKPADKPAGQVPAGLAEVGTGNFTATTPAGWESQPPQPQRFRDLVWRVAGDASTECYLTAFVGGGVDGNVTRWYGQMGQQPAPVDSLPKIEMAGAQGRLLELSGAYQGKAGMAMAVAFVARDDGVMTLKFLGPEAVLKAQREAFLGLAKSLRRAGAAGAEVPAAKPAVPVAKDPAPKDPAPAPAPHAGAEAANAPFTATAPAGWAPKAGSAKLLHHTFGTDGEVYLSQLGGSMRAMLDIWRGEVALGAATDAEFAAVGKLPMLGGEGLLLDVTGDWKSMSGKQIAGARLLVAAFQDGSTILFVKLVGKATEVEGQVDGFKAFCGSLRRAQ